MTPSNFPGRALEAAYTIVDSGASTTLNVDKNFGVIRLITAAAETRTLARPTKLGIVLTMNMVTDGGDCVVTVTGGYQESGSTTITFNDTGDYVILQSVEEGAGTFVWRLIASDGVTGPTESLASLSLSGTLGVTGVSTLTGAVNAAALITGSGGIVAKSATASAITTTRTLTSADSGGIFSVAKTSAYAITLPTPAQGIRFKFLILDTGANAVTFSNGSAHLFGNICEAGTVPIAMTGTTLSAAASGSVGDWLEFCGIDATHYLVSGSSIAASKFTIA